MRYELRKGDRCVAAGSKDAVWAALRLYGPLRHVASEEAGAWMFAHEIQDGWYRFDRDPSREPVPRMVSDFYLTIRPAYVPHFNWRTDYPADIAARERAERIEASYGEPHTEEERSIRVWGERVASNKAFYGVSGELV